ncbi:MAG: peptidoglycan DD-metalloendopeptidase family protein [Magnetococcales bacterium]|nr:peptidoglycan DD-metalloendopeptidase family protein [Magnetococcales bacterium]
MGLLAWHGMVEAGSLRGAPSEVERQENRDIDNTQRIAAYKSPKAALNSSFEESDSSADADAPSEKSKRSSASSSKEDPGVKKNGATAAKEGKSAEKSSPLRLVTEKVRRGDTFVTLLSRQKVERNTALALATAAAPKFAVSRRMTPGDVIQLGFDKERRVVLFTYPVDDDRTLRLSAIEAGKRFKAVIEPGKIASEAVRAAVRGETSPPGSKSAEVKPAETKSANAQAPVKPAEAKPAEAQAPTKPAEAKPAEAKSPIKPALAKVAPGRSNDLPLGEPKAAAKTAADPKSAAKPPETKTSDPKSAAKAPEGKSADGGKGKGSEPVKSAKATKTPFKHADRVVEEVVRKGDNLQQLLSRKNVTKETTLKVANASRDVFKLARNLKPGQSVKLAFTDDNELLGLSYPIDDSRIFWLVREQAGRDFVPKIEARDLDTRFTTITGSISDSLFSAGKRAGLSQSMVLKLAGLFEWDVDFARDIQSGDKFTVVYESMYENNKPVREGEILSAEFVNQGRSIRVVRYTDPLGKTGYYDPAGRNMRKMFIRAPVDFTRISSGFSLSRLHPILNYTRAHKGVDYAAPMGTPVRATAHGKATFVGEMNGFGKLIVIQHNAKYSTAYAHLSGFAPGLKVGQRVSQGDTIGRVGMTGWATGPHLHYEVRVGGEQVNPLSVQTATADPVSPKQLADFKNKTAPLIALLDRPQRAVASLGR